MEITEEVKQAAMRVLAARQRLREAREENGEAYRAFVKLCDSRRMVQVLDQIKAQSEPPTRRPGEGGEQG